MSRPKPTIKVTKHPFVENIGHRKIESVQFATFSEDEVLKNAEVEVYRGVYYDNEKKPIDHGLLDSHMGPANKHSTCETCHGKHKECSGHYGYIKLALPVYNFGYIATVIEILKCICKQCSRILLEEKDRLDYLKKMRNPKLEPLRKNEQYKKVVKKCTSMVASRKSVKCSRCGYINGIVKKGTFGIVHDRSHVVDDFSKESKSALAHSRDADASVTALTEFDAKMAYTLFQNMLIEDCDLLYLKDRPENLIVSSIAVPPIAIRPSVFVDGGGLLSNENDVTERLKRIIQANASLHQELKEPNVSTKSLTAWSYLQQEVAQYINSEVRGIPVPPGTDANAKKLSGFVQRLKGKQGRFRGNLCGKRVEYTGRTVISPDPNLKITEVAIPILMAKILTFPERVSHHNIEKLRQCVRNGPYKYPGAKCIFKPDGSEILINNHQKRRADELKYGDIVHRHLEDGDAVLFNRQPSLHRMSIMCHRARIMPWRTLRFNESVCNPYNADFDGDEMNMHVPQTEEARTEALLLMGVQNNLCTPKNGEILVASTQDFLTSSFLITRKDTFYDRASFSLMCSYMGDAMDPIDLPTPTLIKPVELWTGKQLFSVLIRPHAKMRVYVNLTLTEKSYKGKGVETMCRDDGFVYIRNSELISGQVGKATLGNGNKDGLYSVLLRDYNTHAAAACMNRLAKLSARWIGNHGFSIGIDDVQPGDELNRKKEVKVEDDYKKCDVFIEEYNKKNLELLPGCDAIQSLEARMTGVLNQIRQNAADICMAELKWRNSPLIMSQCGSKGSPINISQMVACVGQQSVGGQRAPNGFIDRTLPHFPTNSKTPAAKGFVKNSFYSGLSATEFFFHTMGGREGLVDTAVKTADTGYMSRRLMKALEDLSIRYDNTVRNASSVIIQFVYGDDGMDPSQMEEKKGHPLDFKRLLMKVKATCPAGDENSLFPSQVSQRSREILSQHNMTPVQGCSDFSTSLLDFMEKCSHTMKTTRLSLDLGEEQRALDNLASLENVSLNISGFTSQQLEVFLNTCISRYHAKKMEAGTAIGAIGAQSIGEPGTQMTLKTFHFAGVASMNVTLGVPRIKEIINAAKTISTPIIEAKLEYDKDVKAARLVKGHIEKTLLGQVAKSLKVVMESRHASIFITLDPEASAQLSIDGDSVKNSILQNKKLKVKDSQIKVVHSRKLEIIPQADRNNLHFQLHNLKNKLPSVIVKGIDTVERVVISKSDSAHKLLVEGTGLLEVMGIDGIKGHETTSNHVKEVLETLGIEAARKKIIDEIAYTMSSHSMTIDIRHMMLLADLMTFKGEVLGITRQGVQKMRDSVLMLASFERTGDHLFGASVTGANDRIEGVSECIIMGIPMHIGTGMLKVGQSMPQIELDYKSKPIICC